jgi:Concanavalin A-like lectin/glucanases superfamily
MARSFNGTSQAFYADLGTGSPTGLATGTAFSMACWFNLTSLPGGAVTIIGKGFDGSNTNYFFQTDGTPTIAVGSFNGSTQGVNNTYTPGTSVWAHVYGDWDGATWHLYVNGTNISSGGSVGPVTITLARYFVMAAADTTATPASFVQWTPCSLADCAVWNGPLNTTDIGNISGKTLGGGAGSAGRANTATSSGKTLLGYWPLNGSGSTEIDYSVNGKNATAQGSPGVVADPTQLQPFGASIVLMGAMCC